jgi:hypothetical protein
LLAGAVASLVVARAAPLGAPIGVPLGVPLAVPLAPAPLLGAGLGGASTRGARRFR